MNKTQLIGIAAIVVLLGASLVGVLAFSSNQSNTNGHHESSQGLSDEEIRDGLMNHGVDHKEGQH